MRCGKFLAKVRSVLALIAFTTLLVPIIILLNRRPSILTRNYQQINFQITTRIPGSFLKNYPVSNQSFCKFNYGLPEKFNYKKEDIKFGAELGEKGAYRVVYNVIDARKSSLLTVPLTYASHASIEFVNYISEIAIKWDGPISLAMFVPDADAEIAINQLVTLCQCLPDMSRVSVHFIFPLKHPPYIPSLSSSSKNTFTPITSCSLKDTSTQITFRSRNQLPYPVNVCRNSAKLAAKTQFILVSDVELIPSDQLATKFFLMVNQLKEKKRVENPSAVYVVPVFEIERYEKIPGSKSELLELIKDEKAVYFHRHICFHCQKFPGLQHWLQNDPGDIIKPLTVTKREYPLHRWEPIYIGRKTDPLYSEALSWEGKQDKMTQMLEMCLIGYKFVILDGAFLVHWPGIKRKSIEMKLRNKWRSPYLLQNSRQYSVIINELFNKHKKTKNTKC
ncbi:beta-1,4-glucuronyltransferase 1-like [Onthophagus taurus]|uniref:beta-1,4-glucuronyltransferase 1-like n=1 Tax=Onthophagus taurus TaxID=166361 RepID=UPI000C20D46B|nr:beta-1,4-glucuronyltransferase 1-like [Onthophagus taurus]